MSTPQNLAADTLLDHGALACPAEARRRRKREIDQHVYALYQPSLVELWPAPASRGPPPKSK